MSKWVRSKYSEDATKFAVHPSLDYVVHDSYIVIGVHGPGTISAVPKCEYVECEHPERWETCTREMIDLMWKETPDCRS